MTTITPADRAALAVSSDREGQRYALRQAIARLCSQAALHRADSEAERAYAAGLKRAVCLLTDQLSEVPR